MNLREKLLKSTDDVKKAIKVPFQVRKDKKTLESWIIDVESKIADLELDVEDAKSKDTLNVDYILDCMDNLELERRRLKQGNELMNELFNKQVD